MGQKSLRRFGSKDNISNKMSIFLPISYHRYVPHGDSWQKINAQLSQPRDEFKWNLKVDNYFIHIKANYWIAYNILEMFVSTVL